MKSIKIIATAMTAATLLSACDETGSNRLLSDEFATPHNVPPFEHIKYSDYEPAMEEALKEVDQTIQLIVENRSEATFENTVIPFDRRNVKLDVLANIFFNIKETDNCDTLAILAKNILPKLSESSDKIYMNNELFERIKHVYENRSSLDSIEQRVAERYYKSFVRNGALLSDKDKETLKEYNKRLALLSLSFGNNMLDETNAFRLVIDSLEDLSGLPESIRAMAAEKAEKAGMKGKWLFTLHNSSIMPFLQYSDRHDLRKQMYEAYTHRCNNGNAKDNKNIVLEMASIRAKRAKLLGYKTHAHYVIEENMAKTPEAVDTFLMDLWTASLKKAKNELFEIKQFAYKYDKTVNVEACDWMYWTEKVRKARYDVEEKELSEYFSLRNVQKGMFDLANKLYGITLKKAENMPVYNEECEVYEVFESNGDYVGLIYFDYFPRESKSGGAWCTSFRSALDNFDGSRTPAQVSIVYNFTQPTADAPALLTFDEVETMFHEFGHALHGLFSTGKYVASCGVVPNDYVELPSQVMENWASEPELIKSYAKHYKTGEVIPDALINKLKTASTWNKGFAAVEYLATAILDLKWHSITADQTIGDVEKFEKEVLDGIGLIEEIGPRYHTTYLAHSFDGGYDAGYYVYKWAELLDADAFGAFKESGDIFNKELASKFRKHCLSEIGNDDPMAQYIRFRGQAPSIEHLLVRSGLVESKK
ncbi:MAG: M3 family metallopeptidase [Bacteroidales bacterium]|nr:M3 family metallopeptidase [Bacteroidales bacterium]